MTTVTTIQTVGCQIFVMYRARTSMQGLATARVPVCDMQMVPCSMTSDTRSPLTKVACGTAGYTCMQVLLSKSVSQTSMTPVRRSKALHTQDSSCQVINVTSHWWEPGDSMPASLVPVACTRNQIILCTKYLAAVLHKVVQLHNPK
jgi:hypothetical protein